MSAARCSALAVALATVALAGATAQAPTDARAESAFVAWASAAAVPLPPLAERTATDAPGALARVGTFGRATRVVAIGESVHGTRELMLLKQRLTDELIARGRASAVVLESGLAEARAVDAWIVGSTSVEPDFTRALSYGWGRQAETIDALRGIRAWNLRQPASRRVRFYGMDLPANGGGSLMPALEPVWSFLDEADPALAARSRAVLQPIAGALASDGYRILGKYAKLGAARDTLRAELDTLVRRLRAHERAYVARTSRDRHAWALRLAGVAAQTEAALRMGWNDPRNPRDMAMADNVGWIVERERGRGVVVLWAHDLHVARVPIAGPLYAQRGPASVTSLGEIVARALGSAYLPLGTAFRRHAADSARTVDPSSVDGVLARLGTSPALLDLSRAPRDGPVAAWLGAAHSKRAEDGYVVTTPARAFDAIVYVDSLSPAR